MRAQLAAELSHKYLVTDSTGDLIAHGLTAKQAYAMASAAVERGQSRIVETPEGKRREFLPSTHDEQYGQYLRSPMDPRD